MKFKFNSKPKSLSRNRSVFSSFEINYFSQKNIFTLGCELMNRPMEHVFEFFRAEFGTEGSITGDGQMILKGRFMPRHIESLLKKLKKNLIVKKKS